MNAYAYPYIYSYMCICTDEVKCIIDPNATQLPLNLRDSNLQVRSKELEQVSIPIMSIVMIKHTYTYVYICAHTYTYALLCSYIYSYIYVYIYIYIYLHIYKYTKHIGFVSSCRKCTYIHVDVYYSVIYDG